MPDRKGGEGRGEERGEGRDGKIINDQFRCAGEERGGKEKREEKRQQRGLGNLKHINNMFF